MDVKASNGGAFERPDPRRPFTDFLQLRRSKKGGSVSARDLTSLSRILQTGGVPLLIEVSSHLESITKAPWPLAQNPHGAF